VRMADRLSAGLRVSRARESDPATAARPPAPPSWAVAVAVALALFLVGQSAYRAVTQSITHDEACTYNWFIARPANLFNYDPNNHVLFTYLAMASVAALGPSELSLRLPTVVAAAAFAVAVLLLLCRTLPSPAWFLLTTMLTFFNPLVLDYLTAARGYGLALALLLAAIVVGTQVGSGSSAQPRLRRRLLLIAVLLALCVAASLAFSFAVAAVAITVIALASNVYRNAGLEGATAARALTAGFALPAVAIATLFYLPFATKVWASHHFARSPALLAAAQRLGLGVTPPMALSPLPVLTPATVLAISGAIVLLLATTCWGAVAAWGRISQAGNRSVRALGVVVALTLTISAAVTYRKEVVRFISGFSRSYLYTGTTDLWDAATTMLAANLTRDRTSSQETLVPPVAAGAVTRTTLAVAALMALVAVSAPLCHWWRRVLSGGSSSRPPLAVAGLLVSTALVATAQLHAAAHLVLGVNLPPPRAAVFLPPLVTLSAAFVLRSSRRRRRAWSFAAGACAVVLLARYVQQYDPRVFWGNLADAGSRTVFERMQAVVADRRPDSVRVGGSWLYEPSMNFYRQARGAAWMQPYRREAAQRPEELEFLIYHVAQSAPVLTPGFEEIYRDPAGGAALARRVPAPSGWRAP